MKTKQIEVQFESAELGDLSNVTELGARATFDKDTAIITCDENQLNKIEEQNLEYVAVTRAKNALVWVDG